MSKPTKLVLKDFAKGHEGLVEVEIDLPPHFKHICDNQTQDGRWSASFRYFELTCVLRERVGAAIQCVGDWLTTRSGVVSTGSKSKANAIEWAYNEMHRVHLERLETGSADPEAEPRARARGLRLSEAFAILRRRGLVPGRPGTKKRAGYELIIDIATAVWSEDPYVNTLNDDHVRRMYEARVHRDDLEKPEAHETEVDEDHRASARSNNRRSRAKTRRAAAEAPLEWPPSLSHRRTLDWVLPQTVQGDLVDLKTLFGKLVGKTDAQGEKLLPTNPLEGLDLGSWEKRQRDTAGPTRYPWVLRVADDAVERMRTEGYRYQETRTYTYKGKSQLKPYNRTQLLPQIVPGMLRYLLVLQFGHPTRPKAIRHVRMADIARNRAELAALIGSLSLNKSDKSIGLEVLDVWLHGGIAYRRRWSKNDTERLVPHSADTAAEHDRYVGLRARWLKARGIKSSWLFPSPRDPRQPISEKDAGYLLACAEKLARTRIEEANLNPDEHVPLFDGTAWYAYRRYWKTLRNAMGWEANSNAAYVGDWTTKTGAIADVRYAQFSPHLILAVVEGKTILEALQDDGAIQEAKRAARIRPDCEDSIAAVA